MAELEKIQRGKYQLFKREHFALIT